MLVKVLWLFSILILQIAGSAVNFSEKVDITLSYLFEKIQCIQSDPDLPNVLMPEQLERVACVSMEMSAAIMECLTIVIQGANENSISKNVLQ
jgi:hypothetical protein